MITREERYRAANDEHKHYDNMSSLMISGIVATPVAVLLAYKEVGQLAGKEYIFLGGMVVISLLFWLYDSAAYFAKVARHVSCAIELEEKDKEKLSISAVYCRQQECLMGDNDCGKFSVKDRVRILAVSLSVGLFILFIFNFCC